MSVFDEAADGVAFGCEEAAPRVPVFVDLDDAEVLVLLTSARMLMSFCLSLAGAKRHTERHAEAATSMRQGEFRSNK